MVCGRVEASGASWRKGTAEGGGTPFKGHCGRGEKTEKSTSLTGFSFFFVYGCGCFPTPPRREADVSFWCSARDGFEVRASWRRVRRGRRSKERASILLPSRGTCAMCRKRTERLAAVALPMPFVLSLASAGFTPTGDGGGVCLFHRGASSHFVGGESRQEGRKRT